MPRASEPCTPIITFNVADGVANPVRRKLQLSRLTLRTGLQTPSGEKEFLWQLRVYHEDTDTGGIVYHANYLKFMERARTGWLRDLGFERTQLKQQHNLIIGCAVYA